MEEIHHGLRSKRAPRTVVACKASNKPATLDVPNSNWIGILTLRETLEFGFGKKVALKQAYAQFHKPRILLHGFDAFGNHLDAKIIARLSDGAHDGLPG